MLARASAASLATSISLEHPDFTNHDVAHADALWHLASVIGDSGARLNPLEGFVLGCSFLAHDLGMASAAASDWDSEAGCAEFRDILGLALRAVLGRAPDDREMDHPPSGAFNAAKRLYLRQMHAVRAQAVAEESWRDSDGNECYLIQHPELRRCLGHVVGQIAQSHWWSVGDLSERLQSVIGSPTLMPPEWSVDPVLAACLLRVADAAHMDDGRAPLEVMKGRGIEGDSAKYWVFQSKLGRPVRCGDRLVFTSLSPFSRAEAAAWWECHRALQTLDDELGQVDALLADTGRTRLAVSAVAHAGDPQRLSQLVNTTGWLPVDTSIRVGSVAELVSRLGGTGLYGEDYTVPLRELIQNSADACRARMALEGRERYSPRIVVSIHEEGGAQRLVVRDNGLGMSRRLLSGALLDFGATYWGSELMLTEHPGLAASAFRPSGQFGVGFFSVFMLADQVSVVSKSASHCDTETHVLAFDSGLWHPPLLRQADDSEHLNESGTQMTLTLRPGVLRSLLRHPFRRADRSLQEVVRWLCPALDVDLDVTLEDGTAVRVVEAGEWQTRTPSGLVADTIPWADYALSGPIADYLDSHIRDLRGIDGEILGRACVLRPDIVDDYDGIGSRHAFATVTCGGLRASRLRDLAGLFLGVPARVARDVAIPCVAADQLSEWATEQARMLSAEYAALDCANGRDWTATTSLVAAAGAPTYELPIAWSPTGCVNVEQLTDWIRQLDDVNVVDFADLAHALRVPLAREFDPSSLGLRRDYLVTDFSFFNRIETGVGSPATSEFWPDADATTPLLDIVVDCIAVAWDTSAIALWRDSPDDVVTCQAAANKHLPIQLVSFHRPNS